ncbi:BtrH N-terminal domain-containing protein [Streptomyces sp. NPDC005438]|uniref:BtrH N-terminal domain-containing protein n=1 Tax=Streptomyces sp. NPDC005438 TaxID=3156880 RepID=UPI0033ACE26F
MRVELSPVRYWRHELTHCLHTTAGVLLDHHGIDPVQALGAAWGFTYPAGDVRREEYYLPGGAEDLFAGLAPFHALSSRWHEPADAEQGWREVREALCAGRPVAVAADNFHLPFRPAYRDVHTNHLMVLYGFDEERGDVLVADPVPPAFQGALPLEALNAARDSGNPVLHDRDMFFTANPIGNRWLELEIGPDQPVLDREFVRRVVAANVDAFRAPPVDGTARGLSGLHGFLDTGVEELARGLADGDATGAGDELFVVIGPVLAVTGLHAEFLRAAGHRLAEPRLTELARQVDQVAHHWSALRIAVATAAEVGPGAEAGLRSRTKALLGTHEDVLERMSAWLSL